MQVSPITSHLPGNTLDVSRMQTVHEQPAFAQLLAATESEKTELNRLSNPAIALDTADERNSLTIPIDDSASTTSQPSDELRKAFSDFVGQTFFGELIKSYRSTQQPAAYFHGGRAEKIFQGQLDQMFAEELSDRSSEKIAEPMFQQFKSLSG
jgi:peptidoglycan hydrolase FlgJ